MLEPVGLLAMRWDSGKQTESPVDRQSAQQDGHLLQEGQLSSGVTIGCKLGWLGAPAAESASFMSSQVYHCRPIYGASPLLPAH